MPDLSVLRALTDAATSGPWHTDEGFGGNWVQAPNPDGGHSRTIAPIMDEGRGYHGAASTAAFIAACREAMPLLLDIAQAATDVNRGWGPGVGQTMPEFHAAQDVLADALAALEGAG